MSFLSVGPTDRGSKACSVPAAGPFRAGRRHSPSAKSSSLCRELVAEVETDATVYGDECKFGGGKVLRDGMGQAAGVSDADALDCVITNALVIDWTGIRKADVGIKAGRISGIGKAGNPDVMAGVTPGMVVGVTTEAIAGEGLILTADFQWIHPVADGDIDTDDF